MCLQCRWWCLRITQSGLQFRTSTTQWGVSVAELQSEAVCSVTWLSGRITAGRYCLFVAGAYRTAKPGPTVHCPIVVEAMRLARTVCELPPSSCHVAGCCLAAANLSQGGVAPLAAGACPSVPQHSNTQLSAARAQPPPAVSSAAQPHHHPVRLLHRHLSATCSVSVRTVSVTLLAHCRA
jgi:hypothetical protein